jgi:hypothetical protein
MYIYDFVIEICIIFVFLITAWVFVIILYMPVDCTVLPLCVNTLVHIGDFYLDTKEISIQSVPITTKVVSSNPVHGQVYSIQHYVIKFVSDLR